METTIGGKGWLNKGSHSRPSRRRIPLFYCKRRPNIFPNVQFFIQAGIKRKSITFDDRTEKNLTPPGQSSFKKKYVKTPIKAVGNKGIYQPPQGKYSKGLCK